MRHNFFKKISTVRYSTVCTVYKSEKADHDLLLLGFLDVVWLDFSKAMSLHRLRQIGICTTMLSYVFVV